MNKRTFKNTYIVLFGAFDSDKFVKFSKFNTVDDFKKHLKLQSQRLLWKVFFAQAVSKT